jgi:hypothetical protein
VGGRQEHWNVPRGRIGLQPAGDLQPVDRLPAQLAVGERHVHDDQRHPARLDLADQVGRILGDLDLVAPLARQHELEELRVHRIVFDDHDSFVHAALVPFDSDRAAAGKASVTRVPVPRPSLSIEIRPPIRCTSDFVMTSPSPAPWWRRLKDPSTWENLTKSRA